MFDFMRAFAFYTLQLKWNILFMPIQVNTPLDAKSDEYLFFSLFFLFLATYIGKGNHSGEDINSEARTIFIFKH